MTMGGLEVLPWLRPYDMLRVLSAC